MARLPRVTNIIFGSTAPSQTVEQFGSFVVTAVPNYTTDIAVIQALAAWGDGWTVAINTGNKAPYVQDMNGAFLVFSQQLSYLFQSGIPEWDSVTVYYKNSVVQDNAGRNQWFVSLTDSNTGNTPPNGASNAFWQWVNPPEYVVGAAATVNVLPKVTSTSPGIGPANSIKLSDSAVSENGTNVIIGLPLKFPDGTIQSTSAAGASFQSSPQTISTPPVVQQVAHGLGSQPFFYSVSIRNVTSEYGYSVGDEVLLGNSGSGAVAMSIFSNATYVGIAYNVIGIDNRSSPGSSVFITIANWKFIFRARLT